MKELQTKIIKIVSSVCYIGYIPVVSGTISSLCGVLIYLGLRRFPLFYVSLTALLFILGFLVSGKAEKAFGRKDSSKIVIDEIASMCLVYIFVKPMWPMITAGFILFRIFDITKLFPAKKAESIPGSLGIMLDDIIAACYTIAVLLVLGR